MTNTLIGRLTPTNNMNGTLTNESRLTGQLGGAGAAVTYASLPDKPSINNVELVGNKTTSDLNISYNDLRDQPVIPDAGEIDERLDNLENDTSALDGRLTTAEGNITSLGGRLTTAEGNITSLGGRLTTAEGNITSLGGRVTTAEENITTLQGDTGALDARVTTAEGNITSLSGRLTTAEGNITSLDGRVTTNEGDISVLQGDISQLNSRLANYYDGSDNNLVYKASKSNGIVTMTIELRGVTASPNAIITTLPQVLRPKADTAILINVNQNYQYLGIRTNGTIYSNKELSSAFSVIVIMYETSN